jgi:adenylosuccinate synthase
MINGIRQIAVTKLDVLDTFHEIKVCVGYQLNGKLLKSFPNDAETLDAAIPLYESFDGWKTKTSELTAYADLPLNAQKYAQAIASFGGTELRMISVGARRDQIMFVS